MEKLNLKIKLKNQLSLDSDYSPIILGNIAFENAVKDSINPVTVRIAIERNKNQIASAECLVFNNKYNQNEANYLYLERLIKTLLWIRGGFRIYIGGSDLLGKQIIETYSKNGIRSFDQKFMANIYEQPFEVLNVSLENVPTSNEISESIGRHLDGCRIGFDAGGSDRKVSALIDGVAIFSEEVIWHPKTMSDPYYHYNGIMDSLKKAASKLPRVDAIGVSSAGIFINNRVSVASLFIEVPQNLFDTHIRDMYLNIQNEFDNVPLEVINDGDVTALAGAMSLDSNNVLGIAMGTSEAAGYVDKYGNITGWLNELAFVPVDYNQNSLRDDWSDDYGVGVTYFSQDAVIKLATEANIVFEANMSPAEKLKVIQNLSNKNDIRAIEIFKTIGVYLGYSLAYYSRFYEIKNVLILGRVTSGIGGQKILEEAKNIIKKEFNNLYKKLTINLPDEKNRRVGQSIAAASLPKITK
ncbi:MAG: ROK family protein [Tenericutes bacterium]|nr:ROK family protein [Mycoplasmatota bacterium]